MDRNELATKLLAAIKEGLEWLGIPRGALDRADEIIFMVFIVIIGLNGLCIRAFDREGIKRALGLTLEPVLVMALGRSVEKAETVEIPADGNHAYYRRDGRHYVPKVRAEELIIPHACGQQH